jgi:hypothetical protein
MLFSPIGGSSSPEKAEIKGAEKICSRNGYDATPTTTTKMT